jgi:phage terminase large subunit
MNSRRVRYVVKEDGSGPTLRGAALQLWNHRGPECILSGPSESGKTTALLQKLHCFLIVFPGAQGVLLRKVRATVYSTCLQTYLRRILPQPEAVQSFGGEHPQFYTYPNGSRLWIAGLDDPQKALSSDRDIVAVNQAEELTLDDWEVLTTRATGRAGNAPYAQVLGDCNPHGGPNHWIKQRASAGRLVLLESRHEDNPALFDGNDWTEQGRRTLAVLDALTGVRKERLRYGR